MGLNQHLTAWSLRRVHVLLVEVPERLVPQQPEVRAPLLREPPPLLREQRDDDAPVRRVALPGDEAALLQHVEHLGRRGRREVRRRPAGPETDSRAQPAVVRPRSNT